MIDNLLRDLRHALRGLARTPGFTATVVITLALGIGANAALFGLMDRVLLRPFPGIPEVDRVVEVASRSVSHPAYRDFREDARHLSALAAYRNRTFSVGDGTRTELATAMIVSGNYFEVLGARAGMGRLLTDADDSEGASPVAVVSHGYWRSVLGEDPDVVGRTLMVNDRSVTVVGVAAPGVRGTRVLYTPDIWVPMSSWPLLAPSGMARFGLDQRTWSWITMVGRLAPGSTLEQAEAALNASAARQSETYPTQTPTGFTVELTRVLESATGLGERDTVVGFFTMLAGVVGLVLLIACANVASLLIARAAGRDRELGIRGALGASRLRLARQLFTEAAVLTALGVVAALVVAQLSVAVLGRLTLPGGIALGGLDLGLDLRMLACVAALGAFACLASGFLPAWHAVRRAPAPTLRGRGEIGGRYRLRAALLSGQVALCLVLLVGTGLFTQSLRNAMAEDPGFRTADLAFAGVNLGLARYELASALPFYDEVGERVTGLPGVEAATWALSPPLMGGGYSESFQVDGYQPAPDEQLETEVNAVGASYFDVMDIPIVDGRPIDAGDLAGATPVAVINETMARRYFPGGDAVGRRIQVVAGEAEVVGVARDAGHAPLAGEPGPLVYLALPQVLDDFGLAEVVLIAHAPGGAGAALPALRDLIAAVDPSVPVFGLAAIDELYADVLVPQRLGAGVLAAFGALALTLALVGVYGVVQFVVGRRTREIGIRMALGAGPRRVLALALRGALVAVGVGIVLGAGLAAASTGAASQFLVGVGRGDPATYAGAVALLIAATIVAAYIPARRATRVDPTVALRHE